MSNFTPKEIEYLKEQRLGRLATVDAAGEPHVMPVGFTYNAKSDTIDIGGRNMARSKKFRDVAATGRAAFVVDDVLPPWRPRGIEVRGEAEAHTEGGRQAIEGFSEEWIRIFPKRIVGWGIDSGSFESNRRSVT